MSFALSTLLLVLSFVIFFSLEMSTVAGATISIRSPFCCQNQIQTRSLPDQSLIRRQSSSSASWSWVGTGCELVPPESVDPDFECTAISMYCTNTLQGSFGTTAVNCVPLA
ncbi:hypothetical protein BC835DRAFT_1306916 [Cytidiella melzeri]|nr:hypothetical protein BC835DRAFT_1306916 [Cytidiella melzeri]